jgi:glyoxylase-like metal-dependent hydrolase (beta-lactamase superfamily II)
MESMPEFQIAIVPVTVFRQNCTLLWERGTKRAAVIDPGGEPGRILATIDHYDLQVEIILLTHGHLDHAGGARALKEEMNRGRAAKGEAPVELVGPDARDAFLLDGIEESARNFGVTGLLNVRPDRWLTEGETVPMGDMRLRVLHVPGHTPGHIVFINDADRFAIIGDVLFRGGVGRTDFPYGDHAALIDGIKTKLLPLGDDITFVCGHGEGSTFGVERQTNPFLLE